MGVGVALNHGRWRNTIEFYSLACTTKSSQPKRLCGKFCKITRDGQGVAKSHITMFCMDQVSTSYEVIIMNRMYNMKLNTGIKSLGLN